MADVVEVGVGVVGEADSDGFGDAVDLDVPDAGQGVGEQVALREDVLARVVYRPDDHHADRAALGEQEPAGELNAAFQGRSFTQPVRVASSSTISATSGSSTEEMRQTTRI